MAEIKVEKSIYELLQEVRFELSKMDLKKTGYNQFSKFHYFQLEDFLPQTIKLFHERGLCDVYNIYFENGIEMGSIVIVKGAESISFKIPTAEANNSSIPIQNLGSKDTYIKRYIYINHVLNLTEDDTVDNADNTKTEKAKVEEKKATDKQVEMIKGLYDEENIAKMLEYYKIESLSELSLKQASQAIAKKKGK